MTTFYLVRHAHAEWSLDENRPLSAQGIRDAQRVADLLQNYPIRLIYSSPELRAYQTISPLAERMGIPIKVEPDLRERKLGDNVFEDFFEAVKVTWQNPSFAHPGGESSADAQRRGLALVKRLQAEVAALSRVEASELDAVVLSTHGNLMALILQAFEPSIDFAFWKSLTMPDVYSLIINSSRKVRIQRMWSEER